MVNGIPISITTPKEKIKVGNRVTRDDGQLALEVKHRRSTTGFDTITPVEMCHQFFGDDGTYLIFKISQYGTKIVQQDISGFRQTQAS